MFPGITFSNGVIYFLQLTFPHIRRTCLSFSPTLTQRQLFRHGISRCQAVFTRVRHVADSCESLSSQVFLQECEEVAATCCGVGRTAWRVVHKGHLSGKRLAAVVTWLSRLAGRGAVVSRWGRRLNNGGNYAGKLCVPKSSCRTCICVRLSPKWLSAVLLSQAVW
jgi:hypothetical protein